MVKSGHEFEIKVFVYIVAILILKFSVDLLGISSDGENWTMYFMAAIAFCFGLLFGHGEERVEDSDEKWLIGNKEKREAEEGPDIKDDIAAEGMAKWIGYKFGGSDNTDVESEFSKFAQDFKEYLKMMIPKDGNWEIISFYRSFYDFEVRGIMRIGGKFIRFTTKDIRRHKDGWNSYISISMTNNDEAYTATGPIGGTRLEDFVKNVEDLMS